MTTATPTRRKARAQARQPSESNWSRHKAPAVIWLECDVCGDAFAVEGPEAFTRMAQRAWSRVHRTDGCRVAGRVPA